MDGRARALARALSRNRTAKACFEKITPSHEKSYLVWINKAKKPETRTSRRRKAVAMLAEGRISK